MTVDVTLPRRAEAREDRTRRLLVVFNPAAGRGRRPRLMATVAALREAGATVALTETTEPGHAEAIARQVADIDIVVAAGGDGTVNEIVNGLAANPAARGIALGMIPLGTANVLADEIGLPRAPRALATVLAHGPTRPIRLGVVNSRRFCMMAGAGFDAGVVAAVTPALKARLGPFAYVLRTAQLAFAESAAGCTVTIDGTVHAAASAVVCKGRLYGGPFVAAPEANVADDLLHVVLMRGRGWASVLRYGAALMTGRIARLADVEIVAGRNIVIEGQAGAPIQADGDIVARLPATIAIDPVTLSVICSG